MAEVKFAGKSVRLGDDRGWTLGSSRTSMLAPYVYRCIDLRAKAVASVRWLDESDVDITPESDLLYRIEASLCVAGAAYILRGNEPGEARVLNPYTMQIETDTARGIVGFKQSIGSQTQRFNTDEVVYISLWHPASDVHGLAPLQVAGVDASTALAVAQFTAQFFSEGALPPLIISPPENHSLTDSDAQAIREAWRVAVQGVRNMWRALFARRRLEVQALEVPHLDRLSMADVDEIVLRRIAVAFGVPVTMITDAANYATARGHRVSFWRDTVVPQVERIAEAWASAYGIEVYPDYDSIDALVEQEAEKRDGMVKLVQAGIVSTQEARVYLGFESAPSAPSPTDEIRAWFDELSKWERKSKAREVKCADFDSHILPDCVVSAVKKLARLDREPFGFARYLFTAIKAAPKPSREDEESLVSMIARVLAEKGKRLPNLRDEEIVNELSDALRPYIEQQVIDAATAVMIATAQFDDIEAISNFAVLYAQEHTYNLVQGIVNTTRDALRRVIPRAQAQGWSNEQIAEALSPYFSESRARTIAVTETTRAYSAGVEIAQRVLSDYGVSKTKLVWRTARDELVCPICAPRNNKSRGKGWNELPPAHPNCRCWVTLEIR